MNEEWDHDILKRLENALNKIIYYFEDQSKGEDENWHKEVRKIIKPYQNKFNNLFNYEKNEQETEDNNLSHQDRPDCSSGNYEFEDCLIDNDESNYDYCTYCGRKIRLDDRFK